MTPALATIDIGTNTTLLLVARPRPGSGVAPGAEVEVLAEAAEITRLGRGIGKDQLLGREGIDRTLAVLRTYAEIAAGHGATGPKGIAAIGTEALRRAPNADAFLEPAARILGTPVEVIAGDREAELTFRAVAASFPNEVAAGRVAVVDIGGGSTEIIIADRGTIEFRRSLPVGSVRLHERHVAVGHDPPTPADAAAIESDVATALDEVREAFAAGPLAMLVGVAGTVTSLAAMAMNMATYDPARVHGSTLTLLDIEEQIGRLEVATETERARMVGLDPRRADVIFAGALLLRMIVRRAGRDALRVSDRGIRWGLFHERAAEWTSVR